MNDLRLTAVRDPSVVWREYSAFGVSALTVAFRRGHTDRGNGRPILVPQQWLRRKRTLTVATLAHRRARHDRPHDRWREMYMASDA
jgi:hypothetical protein